jgi:uncharacterized protein DUF6498
MIVPTTIAVARTPPSERRRLAADTLVSMTLTAPTSGAPRRWPPSAYVLLLANAAPLAGVLTHRWSVFAVVLLYWFENVIVGGFNVLRMLCASPRDGVLWLGKAFLIPFFIVHYGMFTYVHGVLVFSLFGGALGHGFSLTPALVAQALRQEGVGYAALGLLFSHGVSFVHNYLAGGEYERVGLQQLMGQPYTRVIVLHLAVLFGGWLTLALGSPASVLVILIALKTGLDLRAHLAERRKLATATVTATTAPPPEAPAQPE